MLALENNKQQQGADIPISRTIFKIASKIGEGKKLICTERPIRIPRPAIAEIEWRWHFYRSAIAFRRALFRIVVVVVVVTCACT